MDREDDAADVADEGLLEACRCHLFERGERAATGVGDQYVESAPVIGDHAIEIIEAGHLRPGAGDVMGRLRWDRPSVTIRTEFFKPEKGRYLHPTEHRALTHHEAARIQGFPDEYKWVGSKASIARQIGNAVPVALAKAVGQQLVRLF